MGGPVKAAHPALVGPATAPKGSFLTTLVWSRQKVLVPEDSFEAAQHAIEALTDPDELVSDA